jgi:hypothetical protein
VTADPVERAALLEAETAALRGRLDELLDELDRRRRGMAHRLAMVRRYGIPALAAAALVAGAFYASHRWRERRGSGFRGVVLRRADSMIRSLFS